MYVADAQGWFLLYKILKHENANAYFARCYWPLVEEPTLQDWSHADLRTSCEVMEITVPAIVLTNEIVSQEDEEAMTNFLRIRNGIESRKTFWKQLLSEAEAFIQQKNYAEAVVRCTECASFVKYEARVFQLRGHAYLQLERYTEAIADLEHALSIHPNHTETTYDCVLALAKSGNTHTAKEMITTISMEKLELKKREMLNKILSS